MRIFIITLIQLCSVQFIIAQNALFLPFNTPRTEVRDYISSKDYIHQVYHEDETITVNLSEKSQIVYHFQAGRLDKIVMHKYYDKRQAGKAAITGVVNYMGISADIFMPALNAEKDKSDFYSLTEDKVLDLHVVRNGKHTYMRLTATQNSFGQQVENELEE